MTVKYANITIAQGAQNSSALKVDGRSLMRVIFPEMTSTAATIQTSPDGTTFSTLGDKDGSFSIASPSGRAVTLNPAWTVGAEYVRLVAGSAEAAARTIAAITEDLTT